MGRGWEFYCSTRRSLFGSAEVLYAELDFDLRRFWKAFVDPIGHYSRPDVYSLQLHDVAGRECSYPDLKRTPKTPPLWVDALAEDGSLN